MLVFSAAALAHPKRRDGKTSMSLFFLRRTFLRESPPKK